MSSTDPRIQEELADSRRADSRRLEAIDAKLTELLRDVGTMSDERDFPEPRWITFALWDENRDRPKEAHTPDRAEGPAVLRYRKRPVVIEAIQLTPESRDQALVFCPSARSWCCASPKCTAYPSLKIPTLEGDHRASNGDWIIKGIAGEFYPCKPDIFAATYEDAGTADSGPRPTADRAEVERAIGELVLCVANYQSSLYNDERTSEERGEMLAKASGAQARLLALIFGSADAPAPVDRGPVSPAWRRIKELVDDAATLRAERDRLRDLLARLRALGAPQCAFQQECVAGGTRCSTCAIRDDITKALAGGDAP